MRPHDRDDPHDRHRGLAGKACRSDVDRRPADGRRWRARVRSGAARCAVREASRLARARSLRALHAGRSMATAQPSGPVITLSPQGIRDTRIAAETIPWPAITNVSTLNYRYSRSVAVSVAAATEARLTFPLPFRYTRVINRAFGYDEIPIGANGVKTDFETLMADHHGVLAGVARPTSASASAASTLRLSLSPNSRFTEWHADPQGTALRRSRDPRDRAGPWLP